MVGRFYAEKKGLDNGNVIANMRSRLRTWPAPGDASGESRHRCSGGCALLIDSGWPYACGERQASWDHVKGQVARTARRSRNRVHQEAGRCGGVDRADGADRRVWRERVVE